MVSPRRMIPLRELLNRAGVIWCHCPRLISSGDCLHLLHLQASSVTLCFIRVVFTRLRWELFFEGGCLRARSESAAAAYEAQTRIETCAGIEVGGEGQENIAQGPPVICDRFLSYRSNPAVCHRLPTSWPFTQRV
jgi:hypothetical protein